MEPTQYKDSELGMPDTAILCQLLLECHQQGVEPPSFLRDFEKVIHNELYAEQPPIT